MRSGVIKAGAKRIWSGGEPIAGKEDVIVTAYEISDLGVGNANLVVLSACETTLGDIRGTEGCVWFTKSF